MLPKLRRYAETSSDEAVRALAASINPATCPTEESDSEVDKTLFVRLQSNATRIEWQIYDLHRQWTAGRPATSSTMARINTGETSRHRYYDSIPAAANLDHGADALRTAKPPLRPQSLSCADKSVPRAKANK